MYLKRIELAGFKSFADRTQLEFGPGITAIVGPNGSGKSNIADAVRWVLGEQSAKSLRGGKMEEVIFSGSDRRRAVGMAEVSLTVDNSDHGLPVDYSEVTVTRRLFRNGDSEYLLNGNPCRLKDIVELFMDTGVGKEAYSIIGQGRIDEVLNAKPEERRSLFEEAAGISKHKYRKREALRKLEDVSDQLLRIGDIVAELQRQLQPLSEQAKKAEDYLARKEELKAAEIDLYRADWRDINDRFRVVQAELTAADDLLMRAQNEADQVDSRLARERWQQSQIGEEIEQLTQALLGVVNDMERLNGQLALLDERGKNQAEQVQQVTATVQSLQSKLTQLRRDKADLVAAMVTLQLGQEQAAAAHSGHQDALKRWDADELLSVQQTEQVNRELIRVATELAQVEANRQASRDALARVSEQLTRFDSEQDNCQLEHQRIDHSIGHLQTRLIVAQQAAAARLDQVAKSRDELVSRRRKQEALQQEQALIVAEQASFQAKVRTLSDLERSLDGYQRGVKVLLQAARQGGSQLPGIIGVLAELIRVPRELETAMEAALGGAMQNIVTEDEEAARMAIEHLKRTHAGRATFLPLSVMRGRRAEDAVGRVEAHQGWIGLASDLVRMDERYRPIVEHFLGQVLVFEDLPSAIRAATALGHRFKLVTRTGEVLYPGGSMTGGSNGKRETTLLGRGREKEEAIRKLAELAKIKQNITEQYQLVRSETEQTQRDLDSGEQELQRARKEIEEIQSQLTGAAFNLEKLREKESLLQTSLSERRADQGELTASLVDKDRKISVLSQHRDSLYQQLEAMRSSSNHRIEQRRILEEAVAESRWQSELMNRQMIDTEMKRDYLEQELNRITGNLQDGCNTMESLRLMQQENANRREEFSKELNDLAQQRIATEGQVKLLKEKRNQLQELVVELELQAASHRKAVDSSREKQYNQQVKVARLESELQSLEQRLWADYQMEPQALVASQSDGPTISRKVLVDRSARLRQQIREMGLVNLGAIEELARVEERLGFLVGQQQDMLTAQAGLLDLIAEMDQVMSQRFAEMYRSVNRAFGQVFVDLFGGGSAQLLLTDPESLLTTGVEIVAQPPGKKPAGLSVLSGGERALTAIALLFAMLRCKPTPFSILDEIEASLDEANVTRLAACLKQYASESQFIVVTHRKGTMEVADLLIGVTMQLLGVSTTMNLRMAPAEHRAAELS